VRPWKSSIVIAHREFAIIIRFDPPSMRDRSNLYDGFESMTGEME